MKLWLPASLFILSVGPQTEGFDKAAPGGLPRDWQCGVTQSGAAKWGAERDPTAPSAPMVLKQTGTGVFPWCVFSKASLTDGYVEAQVKPIEGREDQAGGVIWRWKGGDDYYFARINALEDDIAIYRMIAGHRKLLKHLQVEVAPGQWHRLRAEFKGARFTVFYDGKRALDVEDEQIKGAGAVGVWTKADSVTAFDAFGFGPSL
jgi:hypothetical protein